MAKYLNIHVDQDGNESVEVGDQYETKSLLFDRWQMLRDPYYFAAQLNAFVLPKQFRVFVDNNKEFGMLLEFTCEDMKMTVEMSYAVHEKYFLINFTNKHARLITFTDHTNNFRLFESILFSMQPYFLQERVKRFFKPLGDVVVTLIRDHIKNADYSVRLNNMEYIFNMDNTGIRLVGRDAEDCDGCSYVETIESLENDIEWATKRLAVLRELEKFNTQK